MRIAAFDVGTNTVLGSVVDDATSLVWEGAMTTRLGEGVDRAGILEDAAIGRTLDALTKLASEARARGAARLVGVGTSAARDAKNGDVFARAAAGILDHFEIIDGRREAALTFRGALFGLEWPSEPLTVVDIGGGSTEIVRGTRGVSSEATSLNIGSVRLFERHLAGCDRPSPEALAAVCADIGGALDGHVVSGPLVMLAGTVTNIAAVALDRDLAGGAPIPHGEIVSSSQLAGAVARITSATRDERHAMRGIEVGRHDVIVAGALLLEAIVSRAGVDEVLVSDGGVRFGLALEALDACDRRPPEPC